MNRCSTDNNPSKLYVISFTVLKESGIAIVTAKSDKQAFQILQNSGSYNFNNGELYSLVQIRDIGMTANCNYGLLMETFANTI